MFMLPNLKIKYMCELVPDLKAKQAALLLKQAIDEFYDKNSSAPTYYDIRVFLQGLIHDLKQLKHAVRQQLEEPNSQLPDCTYAIRSLVQHTWNELRPARKKEDE